MTSDTLVRIAAPDTGAPARRPRLPSWLRTKAAHHESVMNLKGGLRRKGLHTVCESAHCPNIHECFHRGTATFLILGEVCTRSCGFCTVPKVSQGKALPPLDAGEPENVARMATEMGLRYVVITSVTRDDLPDGGSGHFAETVRRVRGALPGARVEVLVPDFRGDTAAMRRVLDAGPDVFNHNVETVPRLYPRVRPQARYQQSLAVLSRARQYHPQAISKSGLMVGLGEEAREVKAVLRDLRQAAVEVVTIGQYLQPSRHHLPVTQYVPPEQFESYRQFGLELGFREVFSAPLVRSSYMAERVWDNL